MYFLYQLFIYLLNLISILKQNKSIMEQTPSQNYKEIGDSSEYNSNTTITKLVKQNQIQSIEQPLREFQVDDEDERDDEKVEVDISKLIGGKKTQINDQLTKRSDEEAFVEFDQTQNLKIDDTNMLSLINNKHSSRYDPKNLYGHAVNADHGDLKDICCNTEHDHDDNSRNFRNTIKSENEIEIFEESQSLDEDEEQDKKNFFQTQVGKFDKLIRKPTIKKTRSMLKKQIAKKHLDDHSKINSVASSFIKSPAPHKKLVRKQSKWGFIDIDDDNALKEQTTALRFGKFQHHLKKLAHRKKVKTDYELNSIMIANDESLTISIQNVDQDEILVTLWDISERFTNEKLSIFKEFSIKAEDKIIAGMITQNDKGTLYCLPYFDSGLFKIRIFDRENEELCQVDDLNEQLDMSNNQRGSNTVLWASIGARFINDKELFVSLYDFQKENAWQFRFNIAKKLINHRQRTSLQGTKHSNFMKKCIYDAINGVHYSIYRFGQCISYHLDCDDSDSLTINEEHKGFSKFQDLGEKHVGQAYLIQSNVLVIRNQNIHFLKREKIENEFTDVHKRDFYWKKYHTLSQNATICNSAGSQDLLVITQMKIYHYQIDPESLMPILQSVIFNFTGCTYMTHSLSQQTIISYNVGSEDFIVQKRNYHHNFRVTVDYKQHSERIAIDIKRCKVHCISDGLKLTFYSDRNLKKLKKIPEVQVVEGEIQNLEMVDQERILNMKVSQYNEEIIVVFIGKNLPKGLKKVTKINVYELKYTKEQLLSSIDLIHSRVLKKEMQKISQQFEFVYDISDGHVNEIFLIDDIQIYIYNFEQHTLKLILNFSQNFGQNLNGQPNLFVLDSNQDLAFVQTTGGNILLIDLIEKQKYVELEEVFKISNVKACMNAYGKFYILANKRQKDKGIFLLALDENDLELKDQEHFSENDKYLIKWSQYLDISDVDIFCVQDKVRDSIKVDNLKNMFRQKFEEKYLKRQYSFDRDTESKACEIVISYKTIYKNTYDIIVCDLHDNYKNFIFRHQSFHLWEQPIKGLMLSTQIFLTISSDGIQATSLSRSKQLINQKFQDPIQKQIVRELHSLQECTYLKINPSNYLFFKYSENQNDIEINIQQQYISKRDKQTQFFDIMQIKIQEISLWEILLFQSVFSCPSQDEIAKLITELPNPLVFFKCLLELDMANMVTILSFDSRCIKALLSEEKMKFIDHKYPIFHKICYWNHYPSNNSYDMTEQEQSITIENALDIALSNNQILALNEIIGYIVKYQNNFVHSYLFEHNFIRLIELNIYIKDLLESDVFCHQFDFDDNEWPQIHTNNEKMITYYNGEIFDIRRQYGKVFKELYSTNAAEMKAREDPDSTFYKIKYTLNLLPQMDKDNFDGNLMDLFGETDQIEIFQTKVVKNLIDFKWQNYGRIVHQTAATVHIVYVVTFLIYLDRQYLNKSEDGHLILMIIMIVCNSFAMFYDTRQMVKQGKLYLYDTWNYFDQLYIWSGNLNLYLQFDFEDQHRHHEPFPQFTMIFFTCMMLIKTFFFLRIFEDFTKLVIMLRNVVRDLREFLIFYVLLIIMFSVILGVLGVGNFQNTENQALIDEIEAIDQGTSVEGYPGMEYKHINLFFVNIITILRFSLADFDFYAIGQLDPFESVMFWFTWTIIVLTTCVIFLNFIIAEVANSYDKVNTNVQELILQERAKMIMESEDMMNQSVKDNKRLFPKYLIMREVEE